MTAWTVLAQQSPVPDPLLQQTNPMFLYAGGAGVVVVVMLIFVFLVRRGGGKKANPEASLTEDLSTYPPAPRGQAQVSVMNQPGRLRLVVIAPVGKRAVGDVESVLDEVLRGLGDVARADKPRTRTWPPQLSSKGFAPTFFRLTRRPDPEGKPSRWVLLAGPTRAGGTPVLLGLAVYLDAPSKLGLVTVDEAQWAEVLRVG